MQPSKTKIENTLMNNQSIDEEFGLNVIFEREALIEQQQNENIAQHNQENNSVNNNNQKNDLEKYKDIDVETEVESFIMTLSEKHGLTTRKAVKIIDKIKDKRNNPNQPRVIDWIKSIYEKAEGFGPQEQRAVFNILQERNWTELLKDKEEKLTFTNKIIRKWKFSKEELAGTTIELAQKGYDWYEKSTKLIKYFPSFGLSTVVQYMLKTAAVTGILYLKYQTTENVVNNKALSEMIDSFKSKSNKAEAFWLKENLDKFRENFPERSFNNQKQFMLNVEKLYGLMDFNTKRMFATTDPIIVINLMDDAARKIKFKLFDKNIPEEKSKDFQYTMMSLFLEKMREPSFRKNIITQNVEKDKRDVLDVLKVFEYEKRNFILEGISQWNSTVASYRLDLEKTRDELTKIKFELAGNIKAQEYVGKVFEKINNIDNFFLNLEKENNTDVFDRFKIFDSLCHGQGNKPLRKNFQSEFDKLNVRELDTIKNHLEYALDGNDKAIKGLNEVFGKIYNFNPQSNIEEMKNKWEISLALVNKKINEFKEKTDKSVLDYVNQGVAVVSSGVYKVTYKGSKLLNSIKNKEVKEGGELLINSISVALKGVGLLVEIATRTLIEKVPNWCAEVENKLKRADGKIINKYGLNQEGRGIINDLNIEKAAILKNMLVENIKIVEKNREIFERNKSVSEENKNKKTI